MTFTPRPYQQEALDAIEATYRRGVRSALLVLPTGCGKTQVFSWLIQRRHAQGDQRPTLVVAHREELLLQARERIRQIIPGLRVDLERAEQKASLGASVVVASAQTIGRPNSERLGWLTGAGDGLIAGEYPGLVVIDEAHHAAAAGYQALLKRFVGPETQVLGCTATPKRLDRRALHGHEQATFQEVTYSYPIRQAITDGFLCDIRGYRVEGGVDLSRVKTVGGEFVQSELARQVDAPERTDAAIRHWREVAGDRRTIAFCVGVEHAQHVAEAFREKGITAEAADGSLLREERAAIIDRFRRGETQVLANCELFTEGFDVPDASCVLLLRPTQSWGLYVQMVGRGTRLAPGKADLIVIDVVDNCNRHQLATVPAILDLPPGLDLQGQSLAKAAAALDEIGEKAAVLQNALPGSWTELQTLLKEVPMFAAIEPAPELAAGRLAWLAVPGGYEVSCGGEERRQARLEEDALGEWWVTLTQLEWYEQHRAKVARERCGRDRAAAVRQAEAALLRWWPNAAAISEKDARWRQDRPTEKQLAFLRRQELPEAALAALTKGQASGLISQILARQPKKALARR